MNKRECFIQHCLFRWLCYDRRHRWIVPNVRDIFTTGECDIFSMTKAGTGFEFEIKISRSDFKADAKKGDITQTKYDLLKHRRAGNASYDRRWGIGLKHTRKDIPLVTPNHFSYVVPDDLVTLEEVPEFAGLYYIDATTSMFYAGCIREIRKPPKIHSEALPDNIHLKLGEKLMYRFWKERERTLAI